MFGKLQKKIYVNMFVIPTSFVAVMSSIIFVFVNRYIDSDYAAAARESVSLSTVNFNFYMDILKSDLTLVSRNEDVVGYADSGTSPVLAQNKLNSAVNSNSALLGVTLYGQAAGISIASSGVSGYATLADLEQESPISSFMAGDESDILLLRDTNIPDNFEFVSYDESYGILSFFIKIFDNSDNVRGLMVADLDSSYIYGICFGYGDYPSLTNVVSLIAGKGQFLISQENAIYENDYAKATIGEFERVSYSHSMLLTELTSGYQVLTVIGNDYYNQETALLGSCLLLADALLIAGDYFVTKKMARHVLDPLNSIVGKMKKENGR